MKTEGREAKGEMGMGEKGWRGEGGGRGSVRRKKTSGKAANMLKHLAGPCFLHYVSSASKLPHFASHPDVCMCVWGLVCVGGGGKEGKIQSSFCLLQWTCHLY